MPVGDRTDDANWLGGMIYVNPADRALFVEKRLGIGWGLAIPLARRLTLRGA